MQPNFAVENKFNNKIIIGLDEAGRGPLAGPVVAGAVILDSKLPLGINDSKKITKIKRQKLFNEITANFKFGVGIVSAKEIDEINILQATKLAMLRAYQDLVKKYQVKPQIILVDGNFKPFDKIDEIEVIEPIIKGDQKSLTIAASSIIAKVSRDNIMAKLDEKYPNYGFSKHQAYPTKFHLEKIKKYGLCHEHRKTFGPCKKIIYENN